MGSRRSTTEAARSTASRGDLYQEVTDRIIAEMETGRLPWVKPWDTAHATCAVGLPRNVVSGKPYSGINILLLWGAVIERAFPGQLWLTFRQAKALGGTVRRGERGTVIVYADRFIPDQKREQARVEDREAVAVPFLKRYRVFNAAQCDGLPDRVTRQVSPLPITEVEPEAERLAKATGADIRVGGDRAFYAPEQDYVQVPPQPAFRASIDYYRTLFHELGHWTGHGSRLGRDQSGRGKTKTYAREELVAELCAAFACAALSITPTVRHADYLGAWLDVLKEDKRAIFKAASQASKAADFLLAFADDSSANVTGHAEAVA
jgi:antirestriction protein ArdC